jgi:hypothetical protein
VEAGERKFGGEHVFTLIGKDHLAETFREQRKWKEAEELERQILETRKTVAGRMHPHTVISMHNLAFTLMAQGRLKEAELLSTEIKQAEMRKHN